METIKVTVKTKDTLSIDLIKSLQGDLKILTEDSYQRLKKSIIQFGISFAIHLYEDIPSSVIYCADGNQRVTALKRMREEGYVIPQVPVIFIEAKDLNEAKLKLLAGASQYGTYTQDGLQAFAAGISGIDTSYLTEHFQMPTMDFSSLNLDVVVKEIDVKSHTREITNQEDKDENVDAFEHKCPKCGFEYDL